MWAFDGKDNVVCPWAIRFVDFVLLIFCCLLATHFAYFVTWLIFLSLGLSSWCFLQDCLFVCWIIQFTLFAIWIIFLSVGLSSSRLLQFGSSFCLLDYPVHTFCNLDYLFVFWIIKFVLFAIWISFLSFGLSSSLIFCILDYPFALWFIQGDLVRWIIQCKDLFNPDNFVEFWIFEDHTVLRHPSNPGIPSLNPWNTTIPPHTQPNPRKTKVQRAALRWAKRACDSKEENSEPPILKRCVWFAITSNCLLIHLLPPRALVHTRYTSDHTQNKWNGAATRVQLLGVLLHEIGEFPILTLVRFHITGPTH